MSILLNEHNIPVISPNWPIRDRVNAFTTTRLGGVSEGVYGAMNVSRRGDNPDHVAENLRRLKMAYQIPDSTITLRQIHSNIAVPVEAKYDGVAADASFTREPNRLCEVLTADCLPILIAHKSGNEVAAIHAGWRSLLTDIIENTVAQLKDSASEYYYWFGPAISQKGFEIGPELRLSFDYKNHLLSNLDLHKILADAPPLYLPSQREGHCYADIYQLARLRLYNLGVHDGDIYGGQYCTYTETERFHSYRRSVNQQFGHLGSYIWIKPNP